MRYTVKDKLKMVKEHVCEGIPLHEIAKKYEYDVATIKHYCNLYRKHGERAFDDHGTTRCYSREEKLKAIDRVINGKESSRSVAVDLMISNIRLKRKNGVEDGELKALAELAEKLSKHLEK